MPTDITTLDDAQLTRIEAVHRGFLYQHLYATAALLRARKVGVSAVVVESDEDVEILVGDVHHYVQVKSRIRPLTTTDIDGALQRFATIRAEHLAGRRTGSAKFVIASNVAPNGPLSEATDAWPSDVRLDWPTAPAQRDPCLPQPAASVLDAIADCLEQAETLQFGVLQPQTLVWKVAGTVQAAAAGIPPRQNHRFDADDLASLFEQIVVQLQDLPSLPENYRPLEDEPDIEDLGPVAMIVAHSGAGKSSWLARVATESPAVVVYFDATDVPGSSLPSAVAREVAARLFGQKGGGLGGDLLVGRSGLEVMTAIDRRIANEQLEVTLAIDNAHLASPDGIAGLIRVAPHLRFVLLCQPRGSADELGERLQIAPLRLLGWSVDDVAAEAASSGSVGDVAAYMRLHDLTAGLPLYVRGALRVAEKEYAGDVAELCKHLDRRENLTQTVQELILGRTVASLGPEGRGAIAVLSTADIPLDRDDALVLVGRVPGAAGARTLAALRELSALGIVDSFGNGRVKLHDAFRILGRDELNRLGDEFTSEVLETLKGLLIARQQRSWDPHRLSLLVRTFARLGDLKTLVEFATDELFHEMGMISTIADELEIAAASEETEPEDRFWALDGLLFADMKAGAYGRAFERVEAMSALLDAHELGEDERLAFAMKAMNVAAKTGNAEFVDQTISDMTRLLAGRPTHLRIFRYNAARARFDLGQLTFTVRETERLIDEYFALVGLERTAMWGKNPDKIFPMLRPSKDLTDHLKHLADTLDLQACAIERQGGITGFLRLDAIKAYSLAQAPDSMIRVSQDLVEEFVRRHDFIGAREIFETNLLPLLRRMRLVSKVVPVRGQYAVVLAYCGDMVGADREMAALQAYVGGLDDYGRAELESEAAVIERIRREGAPPQLRIPGFSEVSRRPASTSKVGRNEQCPCGSGKKYKHCHGR